MTVPPRPGTPFPTIGGFSVDPSRDPSSPFGQSLEDRMFEERVVFLSGALDHSVANEAGLRLMALDASGDEAVRLHVDSTEGQLEAAFALIDVIDLLGVDVRVFCAGQVSGPATGVMAVCHRRYATQHTRFRLVEPTIALSGRPRDVQASIQQHRSQMMRFSERLAAATGQPVQKVQTDMRSGIYLSAEEAVEYGLIDEITRPSARVLEFPRKFGFRPR